MIPMYHACKAFSPFILVFASQAVRRRSGGRRACRAHLPPSGGGDHHRAAGGWPRAARMRVRMHIELHICPPQAHGRRTDDENDRGHIVGGGPAATRSGLPCRRTRVLGSALRRHSSAVCHLSSPSKLRSRGKNSHERSCAQCLPAKEQYLRRLGICNFSFM